MIRKLLILVLILIPIVLLGHYQFGHFKAYNRITAKRDIANGQIKFIIFGELDPNEELHNKAANELGFEYYRAVGCTVDQPFINGVSAYNAQVTEYLNDQDPQWEQQLILQLQQLKKKVVFQQNKSFEIIEYKKFSDYPSSDIDTSQCTDWKVTFNEAVEIFKLTKPIAGSDWHQLFGHYPCVYRGNLRQNEQIFEFAINAGSGLTISTDTIVYYGDIDGTFKELFLDDVWKEEDEE